ncbi:MAG: hypothetical protein ABWX93_04010 [Pseudoxanthomonas sp.]
MKPVLLALLALFSANPGYAAPVVVPHTSVSFEAPAGFTALTKSEIDARFLDSAPAHVLGNGDRTVTIAFELKPFPLADAELGQTMEGASAAMQGSVPGLEWIDRKLVELDGQRWIYLESTSATAGKDMHGILLATPHAGKALFFEFSATREAFAASEAMLRASLKSIRLNSI